MSVRKFRVCAGAVNHRDHGNNRLGRSRRAVLYSNFGSAPGTTNNTRARHCTAPCDRSRWIVRARRVRLTGDGSSRSVRVGESAHGGKATSK